jgi:hypothetical protein
MNKTLIASLVGGVLLWIWQFMSWGFLGVHESNMSYTDKQDIVMEALNSSGIEAGDYFLPRVSNEASAEEREAYYKEHEGEPWAILSYRTSMDSNMGLNMFRGFIVNVLAVFLLCWVLVKIPDLSMSNTVTACVMVGLIGYLTINYINAVWFGTNSIPYLIDAVAGWGLVGIWLGWYLNR